MAPTVPEKKRRRLGRSLLACAVLAAVSAAGLWIARDVPRRRVAKALSERIGADVSLGALRAEGLRDFLLQGVEIRRMVSRPVVESIRIEDLRVRGSIPAFLAGRFEEIRVDGIEVRLAPPSPGPPPPPAEPVPVVVDRLEVRDGSLVIASGGTETELAFTAFFEGVGGDLRGEAWLGAARADLGPPLFLVLGGGEPAPIEGGSIEGLEARLRISDGGRSGSLLASAQRALVRRGGTVLEIPSPSVEVVARRADPTEPIELTARADLPFVEALEAIVAIDSADGSFRNVRVTASGIDVETVARLAGLPPGGGTIRGRADGVVEGDSTGRFRYELGATLDAADFGTESAKVASSSAVFRATGEIAPEGEDLEGPLEASLRVSELRGSLGGYSVPADVAPVSVSFEGRVRAGTLPSASGRVTIETRRAGTLRGQGTVRVPDSGPEVDLRLEMEGFDLARIAPFAREIGLDLPAGFSSAGSVLAGGTIAGSLASPSFEGKVEVSDLRCAAIVPGGSEGSEASVSEGRGSAVLARRSPGGPIEVTSLSLSGIAAVPPFAPTPISIRARGVIDPSGPVARIDEATAESPGLFRIAGKSDGWIAGDSGASLRLAAEGIGLARWRSFLRPWIGDPLPDYSIGGEAAADVEATVSPGGRVAGSGVVRVRGGGFASEDGSRVLEGLDTTWEVSFDLGSSDDPFSLRARSPVGGFQLLWGGFFLDGSSLSSSLEAEVRGAARGEESGGGLLGRAVWTFPEGPRVEADLDLRNDGEAIARLDLSVRDLGATVNRYLRAPLEGSVPFFQRIEAAGALHADLRATLSEDAPAVRGIVEARGVRVAGTGGFAEVEGLDLDLPIHLEWGPPGPDGVRPLAGIPSEGGFRFGRAAAGGLKLPATEVALRVLADSLSLEGGLRIRILGGAIEFEGLRFSDLLRPSRRVETSLVMSGLDLGEGSRALGFLPLEGTLEGYLPTVLLSPAELRVTGGGELSIFGGAVAIGEISGRDVLSRYPRVEFSASFRDVDLGALTRRFDFGEMTGTLNGFVKDCVLFRGVPVRFEAEVRTVAREGVPRTINVKAINNIAILGTGGGVSVFDRGVHRFFDTYTYDALGIRMSLENDVFLMRGLERRGEQELLLRGRLPFRIDVVNAQPGKTVSFRTMLERFRSLDFAEATTDR